MKHDPLCDCFESTINDIHVTYGTCHCELIEKVRIDERQREADRRTVSFSPWQDYHRPMP